MRQRRRLALLAAASVVVLAASGCGSTSAAISVGSESISSSDFETSLDHVYDDTGMRSLIFGGEVPDDRLRAEGDPPGVYTQAYSSALATTFVRYLLAEQIVEDLDLEAGDGVRDQIEGDLESVVADDTPGEVRDIVVAGEVALSALDQADDADVQAAAEQLADDVEVSSRFGTWDRDVLEVVPPSGPRPAPGSEPAGADLPAG